MPFHRKKKAVKKKPKTALGKKVARRATSAIAKRKAARRALMRDL